MGTVWGQHGTAWGQRGTAWGQRWDSLRIFATGNRELADIFRQRRDVSALCFLVALAVAHSGGWGLGGGTRGQSGSVFQAGLEGGCSERSFLGLGVQFAEIHGVALIVLLCFFINLKQNSFISLKKACE